MYGGIKDGDLSTEGGQQRMKYGQWRVEDTECWKVGW